LRLLAIVQAYHHYAMMQLNRQLLHIDNSWQDAEHLSHWSKVLMPWKESSPTDFLHDKDEVSDTVLNNYNEFKKWVKKAEEVFITEKTLTAFCKNVDNLQSVFRLKAFGHIFYPEWLATLNSYLDNSISKTEVRNAFVEYSLFTGKPKPADIAEFRKVVAEIEENILQITNKQMNREIKKKYSQNNTIFAAQ
jgi:tRNA U34 5-methylaminomethyl-2-thiouridine-forming methyltransferase MnmC